MLFDLENGLKVKLGFKYLWVYLYYGCLDLQTLIGVYIQFVGYKVINEIYNFDMDIYCPFNIISGCKNK